MYTKLVPETVNYVIKMPLGFLVYLAVVWLIVFNIFLVTKTFDVNSRIFILKCLNRSNSLVPFPLLFCHYNGRYNQMEIVKQQFTTIK